MSNKRLHAVVGCALAALQWLNPALASAVGGGAPFLFREDQVLGADPHAVRADSLDFTYHGCATFVDPDTFRENGYLWISSFQDVDSVVDSQINYFDTPGYHMYAKYRYRADQWGGPQPTPSGTRLNYLVTQGRFDLYLDPLQDTVITLLPNCQVVVTGNDDDEWLGFCNAMGPSEKSETDGLANGDFQIQWVNWVFTAYGQTLFRDGAGNPLNANGFVFNGNLTTLGGPLGMDHRPEGSGNLFWRD